MAKSVTRPEKTPLSAALSGAMPADAPAHAPCADSVMAKAASGSTSAAEVAVLISQAVHDLRSSLNAVQSWTYVLDRVLGETTGTAARALEGLKTGVQQHLVLIEHMRESVKLLADDAPARWQSIDLRDVVRHEIAALRQSASNSGVVLEEAADESEAAGAYVIEGDTTRLAPLVRHLLVHCLWRARRGERVTVRIVVEPDGLLLRITESHEETQAGADRIHALSDFFRRKPPAGGPAQPARQSTDLLMARRLVEMQGARLSAEVSEPCEDGNVCIAARFPRAVSHPAAAR